jgi:hypothetical protein
MATDQNDTVTVQPSVRNKLARIVSRNTYLNMSVITATP